jgi:hypothetical protein
MLALTVSGVRGLLMLGGLVGAMESRQV